MSTVIKFIATKSTVTRAKRIASAQHMNRVVRDRREAAVAEQIRLDNEISEMLEEAKKRRQQTIVDFYRMGRTGERSEMRNEVVSKFNRIH